MSVGCGRGLMPYVAATAGPERPLPSTPLAHSDEQFAHLSTAAHGVVGLGVWRFGCAPLPLLHQVDGGNGGDILPVAAVAVGAVGHPRGIRFAILSAWT